MNQLREVKNYTRLVFNQCVNSVKPRVLLKNALVVKDNNLIIDNFKFALNKNCYLVGFGKAVLEMARATEEILQGHLERGIISVPEGTTETFSPPGSKIKVYRGAKHNLPDTKAEMAAKRIVELVTPLNEKDILFVLVSGGGSSLLPYPIPPVTLEDKVAVTQLLSRAGANIIELNAVRKKISMVKGGKLAQLASPAHVISLILSDIVGDPVGCIACGPTHQGNDSNLLAMEVLRKYQLETQIPSSVLDIINKDINKACENENRQLPHVDNFVIGSNKIALHAGFEQMKKDGNQCFLMTESLQGSVDTVGKYLAQFASLICKMLSKVITTEAYTTELTNLSQYLSIKKETVDLLVSVPNDHIPDKLFFIFGGETTVTVKGKGVGGRNQELALRFSYEIDKIAQNNHVTQLFNVVLLCAGTDGVDGPTDAAGAFGYLGQTQLAMKQKLDVDKVLMENDSYNLFYKLNGGDDIIKVGPTGTNVMDISILTIRSKS